MNLRKSIKEFVDNGDTTFIDRIMEEVEDVDFTEDPTRKYVSPEMREIRIELSEPHLYIVYRIKAIREMAVKNAWEIRKSLQYCYPEISRYLSIMLVDYGMEIPFEPVDSDIYTFTFKINTALLSWLDSNESEIETLFKKNYADRDYSIFRGLVKRVSMIEEEATKEEARIRSEVMGDMRQALASVLKYVDLSRSDREIVSYINEAIMTRYYDAQAERNGLRRIRRSGSDRRIKPKFTDAQTTVIGFKAPGWAVREKLSDQQAEFLQKLVEAAEQDIREGRDEEYNVTKEGTCIMSGRYAARINRVSYEAARKRLARIRKKLSKYSL